MLDSSSLTFLILVLFIAVAFDFANGFNDSANAIATVVSTRVMSPVAAVIMAAGMNFIGALSGTAAPKDCQLEEEPPLGFWRSQS